MRTPGICMPREDREKRHPDRQSGKNNKDHDTQLAMGNQ